MITGESRQATHYRSIRIDGLEIFYREAGPLQGPVILLLHGFPTSSHMFRDLLPLLSDRYHLIAPDYPGFGNSSAPNERDFKYTFDHLADIMELFTEAVGATHYSLYMQDFGGPVGMRLALRHPERIQALIVQNSNAYEEGITAVLREVVLKVWKEKTPDSEARLRTLFELPATLKQYLEGVPDTSLVSPDAWQHAQWGMDRPGNKAIQFALHSDYGSNVERYPEWQAYFRRYQPPTLVVWGQGDPVFAAAGAAAYGRDLKAAEIHMLDAGHFALETHAVEIAGHIRAFLPTRGV
jgi:pimeloyl-ACP methyl ester carboxylesterase